MEPGGKSFGEYREPPRYDEDGSDASSEVKIIDVSNWDEEPQAEDKIEHSGGGTEITSLNELFKKLDERFERAEEARREDINKFERLEEKFDERFGRVEERLDERFEKAERARMEDIKKFEKLEGKLDEKFERIMKDMKERFDTEKGERGKLEGKLEAIDGKIEGIGEIVDERVQEVKREVNEKVEVVREQVVIISRDVQEEKIHHEKRIKDIAEEVAGIRRMKIGGTGSSTNFPSPPANLQFRGKPHEHPIAFMRGVENYYSVHAIPPEIRSRFFYQMLDEGAKGWADTIFPFPEEMEVFKQLFVARYWSKEHRINYKIKVMSGMYRRTPGSSMQEYATRKIAAIKLCEPPENEEEMVALLVRHFPPYVQDLLRSLEVATYDKLLIMLGRFDQSQNHFGRAGETHPNVSAIRNPSRRGFSSWHHGGSRGGGQTQAHRQEGNERDGGDGNRNEDNMPQSLMDFSFPPPRAENLRSLGRATSPAQTRRT